MAAAKREDMPKWVRFSFAGLAGMGATVFVQPLDLVKNRMQLSGVGGAKKQYSSSVQCMKAIVRNEGLFAVYNGLSAGLFRQATYTTTRLGVYTSLFEYFSRDGQQVAFWKKACLGISAGAVGAFVGTPAEVSLIRMTADGRLPEAERRNYKHVFDALRRIISEEGVFTLWRGVEATVGRAMVVNAAQLATYSQAKQAILNTKWLSDGIVCHFFASMFSGLVTTAASMPLDIAKTRLQNMKTVDGVAEYRGFVDVLGRVVRQEGVAALWKGFTPYYFRLGPHTVLTFIFLEQLTKLYSGNVSSL